MISTGLMAREHVCEAPLTVVRHGVLYDPRRYPDVKDPSLVFDGRRWHLFGTGCGVARGAEVLHSTAPALGGPWREEPPPVLHGVDHIVSRTAPGVVAEGHRLHLFLQQHFTRFAIEAQGLDHAALHARFGGFLAVVAPSAATPSQAPGTVAAPPVAWPR